MEGHAIVSLFAYFLCRILFLSHQKFLPFINAPFINYM